MTPDLLFEYGFVVAVDIIMIGMALWVVALGIRNIFRRDDSDE